MKSALLIIDLQNDYFPGGSMELTGIENAAENAERLLIHFRNSKKSVFHIQHFSLRKNASFFLPETYGVEINQKNFPLTGESVVKKNYPNSFRRTELADKLKENGIDDLVICGAMSHMCVDSTTRAAFDLGFNCTVIHDACATRDLTFGSGVIQAKSVHSAFMSALSSVFAKVVSCDEFLASNS